MIDVKNLRVGNFIHRITLESPYNPSSDWGKVRVEQVTVGTLAVIEKPFDGLFDFEPIPLTEEWLLKFGFSCIDEVNKGFTITTNKFLKERIYCSPVDGVCAVISEITTYEDFIFNNIRVKTIHQLQNLHFALTNQELEIKQ